MDTQEYLVAERDHWAQYHNHKERMAFAATALYLGAAAWLMFNPPSSDLGIVRLSFVFVAAFAGCLFIGWQFHNRRIAANTVEACERLLARVGSGALRLENVDRTVQDRFPRFLADEIAIVARANDLIRGAATSELITYIAMFTLSVLVAIRLIP